MSKKPHGFDFDRKEAADYLGVSAKTLVDWAYRRKNLPYAIVGARAFYKRSDCDSLIQSKIVRVDM